MLILRLLVTFFIFSTHTHALTIVKSRIVGGSAPQENTNNPALHNAVAFIKTSTNKVFCSGALIAQDLIITAKHCLVDKKLEDFSVLFGTNDELISSEQIIKPLDFAVRYPTDWDMFFPSFDIAWVKLSQPAPAPYKPLTFLKDPKLLKTNQDILIAGFGNQSPDGQVIKAGELLYKKTKLAEYLNDERYYNILFYSGEEDGGTCHGDSGGPSYGLVNNKWYILGVANGFDPILTTRAMRYIGDPDFPYSVSCEKNQSLYSFVAAHQTWIEKTAGRTFKSPSRTNDQDRSGEVLPHSLREWCEQKSFGSPTWNTLRHILTKHLDTIPQEEGKGFYTSCDRIVPFLETLENFTLSFSDVAKANFNLKPLSLLPSLKKVSLEQTNNAQVPLEGLNGLSLEKLSLINNGIEDFKFIKEITVKDLQISQQPLEFIDGIENVQGLEKLTLSNLSANDLLKLESQKGLKDLVFTNIKSENVKNLGKLTQLESLNMTSTKLSQSDELTTLKNLRNLKLNTKSVSNMTELNLKGLNQLESISFRNLKIPVLWPIDMSHVVSLTHTGGLETSLDFLGNCTSLERFNLFSSAIKNVSHGVRCPRLQKVNLRQTPIMKDLSLRTSKSCPVSKGNEHIINEFCATL